MYTLYICHKYIQGYNYTTLATQNMTNSRKTKVEATCSSPVLMAVSKIYIHPCATWNKYVPQFTSYTLMHISTYNDLIPFLTCADNHSIYPYIAYITPPLQVSNIFTISWSFSSQPLWVLCAPTNFSIMICYHNLAGLDLQEI